jgi:hypothetical protein
MLLQALNALLYELQINCNKGFCRLKYTEQVVLNENRLTYARQSEL